MKRFHVHVAVGDLPASVRFYSAMFQAEPTVLKDDYAKWQLDDPRVNFAISSRGHQTGINHLGIQAETDEELEGLRRSLADAEAALVTQSGAACCYARSNKHWATDPEGIAWETFHTLGSIPMFGADEAAAVVEANAKPCCAPAAA